ncbi:MAG: hypothetical protein CL908_26380 [Deltaproteobacteria bacterium]|nr:hypothetical protein [Deltaproteobacteria bacterium]
MSNDPNAEFDFGPQLSNASRESLGLDVAGNARIVARAGRMVMVETGADPGPEMPCDRDLVLSCDVRSFPLADLLSLVHGAGKSGFLLFQLETEEKAVYLSRGEVVFAESNLAADRLGACLLRAGLLDSAQLDLAESHYEPTLRFGKVVVELGLLTPRDLWGGVKSQVEEIVRSLFSYTAGWIHFWEGEIEPDNVVRLSLPTRRLIGEGLEKRDELLRFLAHLEDSRTHIRKGTVSRALPSENERGVLSCLDGESLFPAICHHSGLDPRTAARTLQFLQLTGQVVVERETPLASGGFTTADDDVVREAIGLHSKLVFELAAPLIALDGALEVSGRLNRILEESAERGRRLLDGVAFSESATLDPSILEHRALRLTGDRVREVDEALGEIVSYLEFELRNHPQIEDCAVFLEAVDPLRAMLIR